MKICPKCGNYADTKFCSKCGSLMEDFANHSNIEPPEEKKEQVEEHIEVTVDEEKIKHDSNSFRKKIDSFKPIIKNPFRKFIPWITDKSKFSIAKLKQKKRLLIRILIICVIVLSAFAAFVVLLNKFHKVEGSITGDCSQDSMRKIELHDLTAYVPENWKEIPKSAESLYYEKKQNGEYLASVRIAYLGDNFTSTRAMDEVDEEYLKKDTEINSKAVNLKGCGVAHEIRYKGVRWSGLYRNKYRSFVVVANADRSSFAVIMEAHENIYDEKEFRKLIDSIDFEGYENQILCKNTTCTSMKLQGYDYCEEHRCHKEGCLAEGTEKYATGKSYCSEHLNICSIENCSENKTPDSDYCVTHKCGVSGCMEKVDGQKYCARHRCSADSCGEARVENSLYCVNHTCKADGCNNKVKSGKYCLTHAAEICEADGCENLKVNMKKYCREHLSVTLGAGTYIAGDDFEFGTYNLSLVSGSGNVYGYSFADGLLTINEVFGSSSSWGQIKTYNNLDLNAGDELHIEGGVKIKLTWAQ